MKGERIHRSPVPGYITLSGGSVWKGQCGYSLKTPFLRPSPLWPPIPNLCSLPPPTRMSGDQQAVRGGGCAWWGRSATPKFICLC